MFRLLLILILSTFGGTFLLHYLKNYILKEKIKFRCDWDGLLERLCITYIIMESFNFWIFIPFIIALKMLFRLVLLGFIPGINQSADAGAAPQKVLLKAELGFDLFLSPAFAILVGVIFK